MKKILVIEDERILRDAYKRILSQEGYAVYVAADGSEGLEQYRKHQPDLILLDIVMPEMDGLQFLKQAKLRQDGQAVKVIAFSNLSDQRKMKEMLELGTSRHILKSSLSPKQLAESIREMIG